MKKIIRTFITFSISASVALSSAAVPSYVLADVPETAAEQTDAAGREIEADATELSEEGAPADPAEESAKETDTGTEPDSKPDADAQEEKETKDAADDIGPEEIEEETDTPETGETGDPSPADDGTENGQDPLLAGISTLTAANTSVKGIKDKNYTGEAITQTIKVYYTGSGGKVLLKEGRDYTKDYQNNTNAGTAKVIITGIGSYSGTLEYGFAIKPIAIKTLTLKYAKLSYVGDHRTQTRDMTVTAVVNGTEKKLVGGTDFTVSYLNDINVGTATVCVTGVGNYKGTLTGTYKITKAKIKTATLKYDSMTYNGKKRTQSTGIVVQAYLNDGMKTLKLNQDYTVSYKNNKKVGTATVIIKGIGNFRGTITKTFDILPGKTAIKNLTIGHKSITAEWCYKKNNVTGYELQYGAKSDFSDAKTFVFQSNTILSKQIKKLKAGNTYYFRVRTFLDKNGRRMYSKWSTAYSSTIGYCDMTVSGGDGWRSIKVINPKTNTKSMQAAVWTDGGNQDDLKWVELSKNSDGTWGTTFPIIDMNRSGSASVHLYSGGEFMNNASFEIQANEDFLGLYLKGEDSNIDFVQCAVNIARDENIGYGHTWPNTISCSGLVGLTLTYCGYADFIQNDPLGWGYIGIGNSFEKNLTNVLGCKKIKGKFNSSNYKLLKAGDILLYDNELGCHVGIYAGNGYTVEARGPSGSGSSDENGFEVGVYDWKYDRIEFDVAYRIPKNNVHYRW